MEIGGLGLPEIIILLVVFLMLVVPPVAIIALIVFLVKRNKHSNASTKKCTFCAYSIPVEAKLCRFCGREVAQ